MITKQDFTLIGAGIMSATLGVLLKQLMPDAKIAIYKKLDKVAAENSEIFYSCFEIGRIVNHLRERGLFCAVIFT